METLREARKNGLISARAPPPPLFFISSAPLACFLFASAASPFNKSYFADADFCLISFYRKSISQLETIESAPAKSNGK